MESKGGVNAALNPLAAPVILSSGLNMEKDTGAGRRKQNVSALSLQHKAVLLLPQILFALYEHKTVETCNKG